MKPKIPKLTKKERRMWIKALKGTLERYKNEESHSDCLLCNSCLDCFCCVWMWFTKMSCTSYMATKRKQWHKKEIIWITHPRWVKFRVRQIPQWIKKLEEGL